MTTDEYERDFESPLLRQRFPGRFDPRLLNNVSDAGDGSPGLQKAFRNYLHEGGMEKDLDVNSFDIKNVIDININGEIVFPSATIHSSGTEIHMHPNIGNADGNLILHPIGSNTGSIFYLRNSVTGNYGDFIIKVDGAIASLESALGGGGTAPSTLNINDANWDNINIGDASASVVIGGVTILGNDITLSGNVDSVDVSAFKTLFDNHKANDGSDHSFIDQSLKQADSPTFVGLTLSADLVTTSTIDSVDISTFKTAYDTHAANTSNPHTVTLDQAFDGGKIINGASSDANSVKVGDGTNYLKMWSTVGQTQIFSVGSSTFNIGTSDSNSVYFVSDATPRWEITSAGHLRPRAGNTYDIGSSSLDVQTLYYCNMSDSSCADFSHLTAEELYQMFKQIQPRVDNIKHKLDNGMMFNHIDFSTLPDEFASKAKEDFTKENVSSEVLGEEVKTTIDYKVGDNCGIEKGTWDYAVKDLVVKMYEEIQDLKTEIELLKNN